MKKIIYTLLSILTLTSCSEWFNVSDETTTIPADKLFKDEAAFMNALTGIYTQLNSNQLYGENLSVGAVEFMGQNFKPLQQNSYADFANGKYADCQSDITDIWIGMYHAIAQCNQVLNAILTTNATFTTKGQKQLITGELYTLRAALHLDLLRLFQPAPGVDDSFRGMPYMTEYSSEPSASLTTPQILQKIIIDLKKGAEMLKTVDPILGGWSYATVLPGTVDSRLRTFFMNYYAATALLARAYIYSGDKTNAALYAKETFTHLQKVDKSRQLFYYFTPGTYGSDLSFSREHIFGIASSENGLTYNASNIFTPTDTKVTDAFNEIFPSTEDTRYRAWFTYESSQMDFVKFGINSVLTGYLGQDHVLPARIPFIKLGEVALIQTEALCDDTTPIADAAAPIIALQAARGISDVKAMLDEGTLDKAKLLTAVHDEYFREFFGEGQTFYYMKRCNMQQIRKYDGTMRTMTNADYCLPIPSSVK